MNDLAKAKVRKRALRKKNDNDLFILVQIGQGLHAPPGSMLARARLKKANLIKTAAEGLVLTERGRRLLDKLGNTVLGTRHSSGDNCSRNSDEHYWQCGKPRHPIREALRALLGGLEPPPYVRGYECPNDPETHEKLILWLGENTNRCLWWSTLIGIVEAADQLVAEAVGNANIPPPNSPWMDDAGVDEYDGLQPDPPEVDSEA